MTEGRMLSEASAGIFRRVLPFFKRVARPNRLDNEAAGIDDFGKFSDVRRGKVPLAELRPQRVEMFDRAAAPLTEAEQAAMREAHAKVSRVLEEAGDRPLSALDLRVAVRQVNATRSVNLDTLRSMRNCPEAALAVDDILRGRPAVAGPLQGSMTPLARGVYRTRAIETYGGLSGLDGVEDLIRNNPRSRGIIIAHDGPGRNHIFNVANVNGRLTYLDGQYGSVLEETRPVYVDNFKAFDFYRTA
jgi:Papain fold toxin 1, glutamine deamidase